MKKTKAKIIEAALTLFSVKGYDGVSIKDIADKVEIKDSSLYKHFKSKQDIFDSLVEQMYEEYSKNASALNVSDNILEMTAYYKNITEEGLLQICYGLFLYFAKDEYASKFRKLLTIEQFRNQSIFSKYKELYSDKPLAYQSAIFKGLVKAEIMIEADPDIIALHFYSPIFLLITNYDEGKYSESQALEKLTQHIRQFRKIYYREI